MSVLLLPLSALLRSGIANADENETQVKRQRDRRHYQGRAANAFGSIRLIHDN
jgi:hypothetical protein